MGSGASREIVIDYKWWEEEFHRTLTTAEDCHKVEQICSLIPVRQGSLEKCPALNMLFTRHCGHLEMDDNKAQELWRVLRPPPGDHAPWNWNWPVSGDPRQIAKDFHAFVSGVISTIPLLDFVECALGYNSQARSVNALINGNRLLWHHFHKAGTEIQNTDLA